MANFGGEKSCVIFRNVLFGLKFLLVFQCYVKSQNDCNFPIELFITEATTKTYLLFEKSCLSAINERFFFVSSGLLFFLVSQFLFFVLSVAFSLKLVLQLKVDICILCFPFSSCDSSPSDYHLVVVWRLKYHESPMGN